jgi:hypothetical protein
MDSTGTSEREVLARLLNRFGIHRPDHPALQSRKSLGQYLIHLEPFSRQGAWKSLEEWREERKLLSQAGVERLRQSLEQTASPSGTSRGTLSPPNPEILPAPAHPTPSAENTESINDAPTPVPVPANESEADVPEIEAEPAPNQPNREEVYLQLKPLLDRIQNLCGQQRYIEAFKEANKELAQQCEELLVDAALEVGQMASRWDRQQRIAPYPLFDHFEELAASFGKHVMEMRRLDPDPLRATSNLYRLATKIYTGWVSHCGAILEHQHRRSNTEWIQVEWIPPHRFNVLLTIMRSAVRLKLPLDLLMSVYQEIRQVITIGREVISLNAKKDKFEGDCLRIIASPSKDVIPDLCLMIFRDIINAYMRAGEGASALIFCEQSLLIKRGDHEIEAIKAEILSKAGRLGGTAPRKPIPPWDV